MVLDEWSGDPDFRELEPHHWIFAADRRSATGRLMPSKHSAKRSPSVAQYLQKERFGFGRWACPQFLA